MVKIPQRKWASYGIGAVHNHLDYISRNGQLDIENQDGDQYVFVQHLDEKHPRVHLCVMMKDQFGQLLLDSRHKMYLESTDSQDVRFQFLRRLHHLNACVLAQRPGHQTE